MDDEIDTLSSAQTDFDQTRRPVRADQHRQIIQSEHSDRVLISVKHVLISNTLFSGALEDDRIHDINLS